MSFNLIASLTICSDFGAQKIKSVTVSIVSSSICHEMMGPDAMILEKNTYSNDNEKIMTTGNIKKFPFDQFDHHISVLILMLLIG